MAQTRMSMDMLRTNAKLIALPHIHFSFQASGLHGNTSLVRGGRWTISLYQVLRKCNALRGTITPTLPPPPGRARQPWPGTGLCQPLSRVFRWCRRALGKWRRPKKV